MHQTYTSTAPAPRAEQTRIGWREVIGWIIALLGVALAGWNIYLVPGEMHQTYTSTAPAPRAEQTRIGWREVIGWIIALLGVALAGWNIYLAFFRN